MFEILAQAAEVINTTAIAPVGIGGGALLLFARFLARLEVIFSSRMDNIEHAQRGLSKAIWVLLAEISTAGSFVREEAKRMIQRDVQRDQVEAEAIRKKRPAD